MQGRSHPTVHFSQVLHFSCRFHPGFSFLECSNSLDPVIGLSGQPVLIWPPNTQTELYSVEWKMELRSQRTSTLILRWNNQSEHCSSISERLNCAFVFECGNLSLNIKPAKPQCSGLYKLAMTSNNGDVSCIQFNVSIFGESPRTVHAATLIPVGLIFPELC